MRNYTFNRREIVLLTVLALLLLGGVYYLLVQLPVENATMELTAQQEELMVQLSQLNEQKARMDYMQEVIEEKKAEAAVNGRLPEIPVYDNFVPMMSQLNDLLAKSGEYSLTFPAVDDSGDVIRRPVQMNVRLGSYGQAEQLLRELEYGKYRCLISDLDLAGDQSGLNGGGVTLSGTVTFFESR